MRRASARSDADRARAPADAAGTPAERARSPVSPAPHHRPSGSSLAARYAGSALLLGLVLLGLGLYWYGTVLQNEPLAAGRPQGLLPFHLLSSTFGGRQRHLRRAAAPLSVCNPSVSAAASGMKDQFSIWAAPSGPLADQLRAEVRHLAEGHPGSPLFPPHVTVLGDIERPREEVQALMRELAAQVKRYRINFVEVTRGTFFYQCVYLLVAKDEGTMTAAAAARSVFGMTTPPYMPHLSLLYADLNDTKKAEVVQHVTGRLYGDQPLLDTGYDVGSLALWYTPVEDKTARSWCLVEEYPLS